MTKRTTIYLVRHGEVYNPKNILYERLEGFPLSDLGRTQAHKLGEHLSAKKISAIYASPLERTRETAGIVASYHANFPVSYDERIVEVSTPLRGLRMEVLAADGWDFYKPQHIRAGGESLSAIWRRMRHFFRETVKKHSGQEIVVVSHGDPIMISMIKHKGMRLSLSHIRGEEYVDTARGFVVEFEQLTPIRIDRLQF